MVKGLGFGFRVWGLGLGRLRFRGVQGLGGFVAFSKPVIRRVLEGVAYEGLGFGRI